MSEEKDHLGKTTPRVVEGGKQPSKLNPKLLQQRKKRAVQPVSFYVKGILDGDRVILGQAITLIESEQEKHQETANAVVEHCLPHSGNSIRIGITGTPGVGKSTFIEVFGKHLISNKRKVAVLAVDPSSQVSKGSILGDKTRMANLSGSEQAFIRPSPAGTSLGGVARKTRETIVLCEAAGYDCILVETVGVGQSEIAVHSMVDFFLLLLLPGAGDELQGIKRGIVEMADLLAVNKADGKALDQAKQSKRAYANALHLFPANENNWKPKVVVCSAISGMGIDEIWEQIAIFENQTRKSGYFNKRREQQAKYWLNETISQQLRQLFYEHPSIKANLKVLEEEVTKGRMSPFKAAESLMLQFRAALEP